MFTQVFLLIVTLLTVYYFRGEKRMNLPPGPSLRLPILGHLPFLGVNPPKTLLEWSKTSGPILHLHLGSYEAIVINGSQLIRKAFNLNSFAGRPDIKRMNESTGNRRGFMFSDGPNSAVQRKFTQKTLKDFGYGSHSMESRILDQIPSLLAVFETHLDKPLNVKYACSHEILNVMWSIVAGEVLNKNDKSFHQMAKNISSGTELESTMEKLALFLKFLPDWLSDINGKVRCFKNVQEYLDPMIEEHRRSKTTDQPRDIIDAYLDEVEKTSDPQSPFFESHGNITVAVQDLLSGAMDTTRTTLEWLLFYLAKYPNVQGKLQKEIDNSVEKKRLASSEDRQNLPYVEAVIQEVSRISSIVPLSILHSALEDTTFHGYCIPKGMIVIGNLYGVHHDKDIWSDPEIFRPERFLDADGNFIKSEDVLAFSTGKRSCIGEHLAKLQLFLYTVSIFQRFNVKPVGELPSEDGVYGLISHVHPFQLHIYKRE